MIIKKFCILMPLAAFFLVSCFSGENTAELSTVELPDYSYLLQMEPESLTQQDDIKEDQRLPVRFYMDNTRNMQAFIFDESMHQHADLRFVHLMYALKDMERIYCKASYYTLQQNEQADGVCSWMQYDENIYDHFQEPEFYFGSTDAPLSIPSFDEDTGSLSPEYINIVMTDLAKPEECNKRLAAEVQKLCADCGCTAYLLAFWFESHGMAKVPDPDEKEEFLEAQIDGARPCYVILTGPSQHLESYMKGFLACLKSRHLRENADFYAASSQAESDIEEPDRVLLDRNDIVFEKTADYDDIKREISAVESSKKEISTEESSKEELSAEESTELSKNFLRNEALEKKLEDTISNPPIVCYYKKVEGISKDQSDWRLSFQIPLPPDEGDSNIEHTLNITYYAPLQGDEGETIQSEPEKWKEISRPPFEVSWTTGSWEKNDDREAYLVKASGYPDPTLDPDSILMILTIKRKVAIFYSLPDWLSDFDTGSEKDYFQKTYGFQDFCDLLLGCQKLKRTNNSLVSETIYAELPVLIMGLRGGKNIRSY